MLALPPISLYIHFPWCVKKCPYCDFNSHTLKNKMPDDEYLDCLIQDLKNHQDDLQGRMFESVFLGGGTPSLFPTEKLAILFEYLTVDQRLAKNAEITIEVNPGAIERGNFNDYRKMGINRVSLGVQSFQSDKLKSLGRIHTTDDIYLAVDELKESGFKNYNIDLMHGLPRQNSEDACFDLQQAISLNPSHISWYQLTIEPNTAFEHQPPKLPEEDELFDIESNGKQLLQEAGYKQYEISAFAKNKQYAKHNLNYWQFGDYIGIGAGAHSKVTYPLDNQIKRIWKIKHPKFYISSEHKVAGSEMIKHQEQTYEFMLNALRLTDGVSVDVLENRISTDQNKLKGMIQQAVDKGLLISDSKVIRPTQHGFLFLNDLINLFAS
ncbi:radical SAM family heme chaperone HemW [Thiotrichales bacterium 19S11-10]|nr:radical SAM family heme chaperone HemW [Thiotrichales bacterium 19S11-10]